MEDITLGLDSYIKEGSSIVRSDGTPLHLAPPCGLLVIRPALSRKLTGCKELMLNARKRLRKIKTDRGDVDMSCLVVSVLASVGYSVNQSNVDCVSNDVIEEVWRFLDKAKTTLSQHPREMIKDAIGPRSRAGFVSIVGVGSAPLRSQVRYSPFVLHTGTPFIEDLDYDHLPEGRLSFASVMLEDMVSVSLSAVDPIEAFMSCVVAVSRAKQGSHNRSSDRMN